jgi:hypothetical protein
LSFTHTLLLPSRRILTLFRRGASEFLGPH